MTSSTPSFLDCDITNDQIEAWLHCGEDLVPDDEGVVFEPFDDYNDVDPFGGSGFDFG